MPSRRLQDASRTIIRVLVVDDHPWVATALRAAAREYPDCEIVGEVLDAAVAMEAVAYLRPNVVILDIRSGRSGNGIDLARQLRGGFPDLKIVVLSGYDLYPYVRDLYRFGVDGYLLKSEPMSAVLEAVRSVVAGTSVFDPKVLARLRVWVDGAELTDGEIDMLEMVAEGLANDQIAERLSISRRGVERIVTNVFGKLGARNRTEAVVRAAQLGLVVIDD